MMKAAAPENRAQRQEKEEEKISHGFSITVCREKFKAQIQGGHCLPYKPKTINVGRVLRVKKKCVERTLH